MSKPIDPPLTPAGQRRGWEHDPRTCAERARWLDRMLETLAPLLGRGRTPPARQPGSDAGRSDSGPA